MVKPRYRLAIDARLSKGVQVELRDNAAHYLTHVLRLKEGDAVALFNRVDGEWCARIVDVRKKVVVFHLEDLLRSNAAQNFHLTICFAPIKGGRMETIIEKATELGASVLQPVITARTIVDKVNLERAEAIAREAAEQCERIDWPEIREPVKLMKLLGEWPADIPLIYGDERGESGSISHILSQNPLTLNLPQEQIQTSPQGEVNGRRIGANLHRWSVLVGPEGGFTPDEFAALKRLKMAHGVGLGPRILRADTAVITLCAATLMAWGDWDQLPRFVAKEE